MSSPAPTQIQHSNIGEMLHANNIAGSAPTSNHGGGFVSSGGKNGGMGGNIDENLKFGEGINISTASLDSMIPKGGVFEGELFAFADGALAMGKISYDDFLKIKKENFKLDVSIAKETGFSLGANLGFISGGEGQER